MNLRFAASRVGAVCAAAALAVSVPALGASGSPSPNLSLSPTYLAAGASTASFLQSSGSTQEKTTVTTVESGKSNDLGGPYFLRSADPEGLGVIALKLKYEYVKEHKDEDHELEGILEWGMAENWEFILEVPVELGDGKVEGNGDIAEFGFHTRLWEESEMMPAFAVRNLVRLPTGYHSDGVDYTLIGLFTKTLTSDGLRCHFNPFLKSINGNQEEGDRDFRWGAALGMDYKLSDEVRVIADYIHQNSEEEGNRNQHSVELGLDWEFAPEQTISVATEFELDGDNSGDDFSARVQYMIDVPGPIIGG